MKSITVYCGSSTGANPIYAELAVQMGQLLAQEKMTLVYGGGKVGLMGCIADATLKNGGKVIGVIPKFLRDKEVVHETLDELIVYDTMHERKQKMYELSEGFLALPGGFGTMDELFEMLTWGQLGIHQYPIALLNVNGYYDNLLRLLDQMVEEQLLKRENRNMLIVETKPSEVLEKMLQYNPPKIGKWITPV